MKMCIAENCAKPSHARSLCYMHYWRLKKHGDIYHEKPKFVPKKCSVDGCINMATAARGWCPPHYEIWRVYKTPLAIRQFQEKHGNSKTREYKIWAAMKNRCYNPNGRSYSRYGGRGINVCARWRNTFSNFMEDMGNSPANSYSIDRIDNDGNYEPSNCRWATRSQQSINKGLYGNNKTGYRGIYLQKSGNWYVTIQHDNISHRLGTFKTLESALTAYNNAAIKYHGEDAKLNILPS